jgi:hypothetical protein
MGLFNDGNNGNASNHILAVELDTVQNNESMWASTSMASTHSTQQCRLLRRQEWQLLQPDADEQ